MTVTLSCQVSDRSVEWSPGDAPRPLGGWGRAVFLLDTEIEIRGEKTTGPRLG